MEKINRVFELLRRAYLETLACYVPFKSMGEKALNKLISENLIENIKGVVVFSDYKERAEKALEFLLSKNLVDKKLIEDIEENSKHWYDLKHMIEESIEKRIKNNVERADKIITKSKEIIENKGENFEDLKKKRLPSNFKVLGRGKGNKRGKGNDKIRY